LYDDALNVTISLHHDLVEVKSARDGIT